MRFQWNAIIANLLKRMIAMSEKENRPFEFPIEIPPKEQKANKWSIVDVVEAECYPEEADSKSKNGFYPTNDPENMI